MPSTSSQQALTSSLVYLFCSVSMILSNKALSSSFPATKASPTLMVAFQCFMSFVCCEFGKHHFFKLPSFDGRRVVGFLPLSLLFVVMVFTSYMALAHLTVPTATAIKNLNTVFIVVGDWMFFHNRPTDHAIVALAVIIAAAVVPVYNDIEFSFVGYMWMLLNCVAASSYVLYMRRLATMPSTLKLEMLYYNNLVATPMLVTMAALSGELQRVKWEELITPECGTLMLFAGLIGFLLNMSVMWCVHSTSPTTYAIVGSLNKIPVVLFGWLLFGHRLDAVGGLSIAASVLGGLYYSVARSKAALPAREERKKFS